MRMSAGAVTRVSGPESFCSSFMAWLRASLAFALASFLAEIWVEDRVVVSASETRARVMRTQRERMDMVAMRAKPLFFEIEKLLGLVVASLDLCSVAFMQCAWSWVYWARDADKSDLA